MMSNATGRSLRINRVMHGGSSSDQGRLCYNLVVDSDTFADLVSEAVDSLPQRFADALDNVDVVVEDWPDAHTLHMAGVRSPYGLLGFYHGVPLTARTTSYGLVSPDKISIYRMPIESQCRTEQEVRDLTHRVVLHEIAHYFGISDDRLRQLGAY
jgi:predicted Zn-dependent protease with MMP-like domain